MSIVCATTQHTSQFTTKCTTARSRSFVEYPYALYVLLRNIPLKILLRVI